MNVVNDAVETLRSKNRGRWLDVNLDVATSHIKISDVKVCPPLLFMLTLNTHYHAYIL